MPQLRQILVDCIYKLSPKGEFLRLSEGSHWFECLSFTLCYFWIFVFSPKDPSNLTSLIVWVVGGGWVVVVGVAYYDYRTKYWLLTIFSNFLKITSGRFEPGYSASKSEAWTTVPIMRFNLVIPILGSSDDHMYV